MSGRKRARVGKYLITCDFTAHYLPVKNASNIESKVFIYEFAVEYKTDEDFLEEYNNFKKLFEFVPNTYGAPLNAPAFFLREKQMQKNNYRNFCSVCESLQPEFYEKCEDRDFVSQENELGIHIRDIYIQNTSKPNSVYCPKCMRKLFTTSTPVTAKISLQDVRLRSRPTCLNVWRDRIQCPTCRELIGENGLPGIQAYCDGKLTCRLAENVLYAHLSSIKRKTIAEAYGLSYSQIDRIRARMLEQSHTVRDRQIQAAVRNYASLPAILRESTVRDSVKLSFYFVLRPKKGAVLIDILSESDRNALHKATVSPAFVQKRFPTEAQFYRACYCCLAGERGLQGKTLIESLDQLLQWYRKTFAQSEQRQFMGVQFLSGDLYGNDSSVLEFLRRKRKKTSRRSFPFDENGQYILPEFEQLIPPNLELNNGEPNVIDSFFYELEIAWQNSIVSTNEIKNRLLYLNPAAITKAEIDILTGRPSSFSARQLLELEGVFQTSLPFGTPVPCLIHFLKHGLLDSSSQKLFSCALIQGEDYSEDGQRNLPCGLQRNCCIHIDTAE